MARKRRIFFKPTHKARSLFLQMENRFESEHSQIKIRNWCIKSRDMKRYIVLIIAITILVYLFLPSRDDSREIEAVIHDAIEAGKKKDLDGVMEHLSIEYRDDYGTTYPVIKNVVKNLFGRFDTFDGKYFDLKVSMNETEEGEKRAVANFDIYISGINSGTAFAILGSEDSPKNLTVTLKKSKLTGWKIIKVEGVDQEDRFYNK